MSDVDRLREQLSAWLDGELAEAEAGRMEEAVRSDAWLVAEAEQLRATRDLIRSLPRNPAPEGFTTRVLTRAERLHLLGAPQVRGYASRHHWMSLATAAVVLLAAGAAVFIMICVSTQPTGEEGVTGPRYAITPPEGGSTHWTDEKAGRETAKPAARKTDGREEALTERPAPGAPPAKPAGPPESVAKPAPAPATIAKDVESDVQSPEMVAKPAAPVAPPAEGTVVIAKGPAPKDFDLLNKKETALGKAGKAKAGPDEEGLEGEESAAVQDVVIYTDNLAATRQDVEKVLERNSIKPVVQEKTGVEASNVAMHSRANFFHANRVAHDQVEYIAYVEPRQVSNVQNELNSLAARQKVSQAPDVFAKQAAGYVKGSELAMKPASPAAAPAERPAAEQVAAAQHKAQNAPPVLPDKDPHKVRPLDSRPAAEEKAALAETEVGEKRQDKLQGGAEQTSQVALAQPAVPAPGQAAPGPTTRQAQETSDAMKTKAGAGGQAQQPPLPGGQVVQQTQVETAAQAPQMSRQQASTAPGRAAKPSAPTGEPYVVTPPSTNMEDKTGADQGVAPGPGSRRTLATQRGRAETQSLQFANVQALRITLNYRLAGGRAGGMAALEAASQPAASREADAAMKGRPTTDESHK